MEQDVLDLMNYTRGFKTLNLSRVRDHFHGKMGKVSYHFQMTGSSWSFASLDEAKLPQVQISLSNMKKIREFWMKLDVYV